MKKTQYKTFHETVYHFQLQGRLDVYLIKKPDFSKTYVTLSAPLGSIHRRYKDGEGTLHEVPAGAAHFLEHKIFERDGKDISEDFSMDEAQINAFTEHHRTTYLFSATNHVLSNVERLFKAFFFPDFTDKGVEKEKNIIAEELNMHLDDPYYEQYHRLMRNLYQNHPLREDILGTKESIGALRKEHLKAMHEAYYQPEKATCVIVGDLDAYRVKAHLTENAVLPEKTFSEPVPHFLDEPANVQKEREVAELDLLMPSVLIGVKFLPEMHMDIKSRIRERLSLSILMSLLLGKSSDVFERMMESGVINDTYGLDVAVEDTYSHVLIGTETEKPEAFEASILEALKKFPEAKITDADFRRIKNNLIGSFIHGLDSLEALAHQFTEYIQYDIVFFDVLEIAQSITKEEILSLAKRLDTSKLSRFIAMPQTKQGDV